MDKTYGHDIGTRLWKEVMEKLESCSFSHSQEKSRHLVQEVLAA